MTRTICSLLIWSWDGSTVTSNERKTRTENKEITRDARLGPSDSQRRETVSMQLILKNETLGEVVVVRCRGRIVTGDEAQFLQGELDKLTQLNKHVVLQLAEVTYLD